MTIITRRAVIECGLAGIAMVALPFPARASAPGFSHGVASGNPKQDRIVLWTRFLPAHGGTERLRVEVAEDMAFRRPVARHLTVSAPDHDWCAQVTATGLDAGRWYFYRFVAPDGSISPTGRTRTLPAKGTDPFRIAVVSCSNMNFGYFNAYRHIAQRSDIDMVLHLGDYIYEYGNGRHSIAELEIRDRLSQPPHETLTLEDYRQRYAWYRADPDLLELHRLFPMISIIDDHEVANNTWPGGAANHQPDEGSFEARKIAAIKAYHEWLPMPVTPYESYEIGELATIFRLETRLIGRDKAPSLNAALTGARSREAALTSFRDGILNDPNRHLLGSRQESWLGEGLADSVHSGRRWQVVAQQVVMGERLMPGSAANWIRDGAEPGSNLERDLDNGIAAAKFGIPFKFQCWDGYPAARSRLLASAQAAGANLIVLSGDSHNAWAFDLAHDGHPAGVEFAGQSVTSRGFEGRYDADPARIAKDMVAANPALRWCDTSHRGYMAVTFSHDSVRCDWNLIEKVETRSAELFGTITAAVAHGSRRLEFA